MAFCDMALMVEADHRQVLGRTRITTTTKLDSRQLPDAMDEAAELALLVSSPIRH